MEKREMGRRLRARGTWILMLAGALGVCLLLIGSLSGTKHGDGGVEETAIVSPNSSEVLQRYVETLESKITSLCESVSGVSRVRVAVTLASGYEYVYAKDAELDSNGSGTTGSYHYLTVGSGSSESAVYLSEKPPTIGGIGIVCTGGSDPTVKKELVELVSAAFGVPSNKIYVAEGGGD